MNDTQTVKGQKQYITTRNAVLVGHTSWLRYQDPFPVLTW